jgi:hypothetical protein
MRARDALLVGAVTLVIGFAALDALRGEADSEPQAVRPVPPEVSEEAGRIRADLPRDLAGRLIFTDEQCRVVELELSQGAALARTRRVGSRCGLWAPQAGDRIAYGAGPADDERLWFRIADLSEGRDSRAYLAVSEPIWSPDGMRLAWCSPDRSGFEFDVGRRRFRALDECADAYTVSGEPASIRGQRVLAGGEVVFTHRRRVSQVSFGDDGSVAVSAGRDIELYRKARDPYPLYTVSDVRFRDRPIFGPGNCGTLLRSPHTGSPPEVTVLALGCARIRGSRVVPGNEAAWSRNGRWIAVANVREIALYDVTDPARDPVLLPLAANQIVWLS